MSMRWPKYTPKLPDFSALRTAAAAASSTPSGHNGYESLGYDLDHIHLLVVDDDVRVFIDGCGEVSVAVRKQALSSLTELLQARPADQLILESWVAAALPLAADPGAMKIIPFSCLFLFCFPSVYVLYYFFTPF